MIAIAVLFNPTGKHRTGHLGLRMIALLGTWLSIKQPLTPVVQLRADLPKRQFAPEHRVE